MLKQEDILQDLKSLIPEDIIKVNEPLKRYTYTETGGNADFYLSPTKNEDVQAIVRYAKEKDIRSHHSEMGQTLLFVKAAFVVLLLAYYH